MTAQRFSLLAVIAILSLGTLTFAACGGGDDEDSGGGGAQTEQADTTATGGETGGSETDAAEEGGGEAEDRDPAALVEASDANAGKSVFSENCAGCHGQDGGGGVGPKLSGEDQYTDAELVVNQIRKGGGSMPAFEGRLDDSQIGDVAAYVTKDLAAGN